MNIWDEQGSGTVGAMLYGLLSLAVIIAITVIYALARAF
jgi:hypothetical protein